MWNFYVLFGNSFSILDCLPILCTVKNPLISDCMMPYCFQDYFFLCKRHAIKQTPTFGLCVGQLFIWMFYGSCALKMGGFSVVHMGGWLTGRMLPSEYLEWCISPLRPSAYTAVEVSVLTPSSESDIFFTNHAAITTMTGPRLGPVLCGFSFR